MDGSHQTAPGAGRTAALPEMRLNSLLGSAPALSIAAAESCSGGGIAQRITSVAGSSAYFLGSIVAYSNDAKHRLLMVPTSILDQFGAVSAECATAMAEGARVAFGAGIAVSTTGIAGPAGATARKPVGLVYIAVSDRSTTRCQEYRFSGDRRSVVAATTDQALAMLVAAVEAALNIV